MRELGEEGRVTRIYLAPAPVDGRPALFAGAAAVGMQLTVRVVAWARRLGAVNLASRAVATIVAGARRIRDRSGAAGHGDATVATAV